MNKVILLGNLTKDPELQYSQGEIAEEIEFGERKNSASSATQTSTDRQIELLKQLMSQGKRGEQFPLVTAYTICDLLV